MTNNEAIRKLEEFVFEDRAVRQDILPEDYNDYDIYCEENNVAILQVITLIRDLRIENVKLNYKVKNRERKIEQLEESNKNQKEIQKDMMKRNIQLLKEIEMLKKTCESIDN